MATTIYPRTVDSVELTEHLQDQGIAAIMIRPVEDGMLVECPDAGDAALLAALALFVPTKPADGSYRGRMPSNMKSHLQHLRDYVSKDPTLITNAESVHVIKDLIRAVHYLNGRLASE